MLSFDACGRLMSAPQCTDASNADCGVRKLICRAIFSPRVLLPVTRLLHRLMRAAPVLDTVQPAAFWKRSVMMKMGRRHFGKPSDHATRGIGDLPRLMRGDADEKRGPYLVARSLPKARIGLETRFPPAYYIAAKSQQKLNWLRFQRIVRPIAYPSRRFSLPLRATDSLLVQGDPETLHITSGCSCGDPVRLHDEYRSSRPNSRPMLIMTADASRRGRTFARRPPIAGPSTSH